jgi:hypothetical protein
MITLVPYANVNGHWTVPDEVIHEIFHKLVSDGLLKTVFYDGRMTSPDGMVSMLKDPLNIPVVVLVDGIISGLWWINGVKSNYALSHFFCFRETWGVCTKEIGEAVLNYWFSFPGDDGPLFDVLIGMVPGFNEKAIQYAEEVGFNRVGTIPKMVNKEYPMVILYRMRN